MSEISHIKKRLFELIQGSIRTGRITLASGKVTDFYFDGRTVSLLQEGAALMARLFLEEIKKRPGIQAIGGPTSGADPIVSSIGLLAFQEKIPLGLFYIRKEAKAHGMQKRIEGPEIQPGAQVFLVDDILTSGGSLIEAAKAVQVEAEARVRGAFLLVDREEGGRQRLEAEGLEVVALFRKSDFSILTKRL
ncbi:MAG: orotate phosphoribosyltransferase [Planctomycetes bacterium]|nr:orotate phosphoribosyltransferase [Planctomycetota bacterium]